MLSTLNKFFKKFNLLIAKGKWGIRINFPTKLHLPPVTGKRDPRTLPRVTGKWNPRTQPPGKWNPRTLPPVMRKWNPRTLPPVTAKWNPRTLPPVTAKWNPRTPLLLMDHDPYC